MRLRNIILLTSVIVAIATLMFIVNSQPSRYKAGENVIGAETGRISKDPSLRTISVNTTRDPLDGAASSISPNSFDYIASNHTIIQASALPHANSNGTGNDTLQANDVSYNVRFICGSVLGNEGPLRPGHYDTDISLFNNQGFTIPLIWNAVSNNGKSTTSILKTLQPGTSTGIACKDLFQLFGIQDITSNLTEGFIVIRPQTSVGGLASFSGNSATVPSPPQSPNRPAPLTVQVFYSANALLTLPHIITMDKILFSISNDTSSKIPASLLGKKLDVTVQSQFNQISDPEFEIRNLLATKYRLSPADVTHLKIQIISVGSGATSMIDDHAISSFQVPPQAAP